MFRILLAEPQEEYRNKLEALLRGEGFEVHALPGGAAAADILRRRHSCDLLLTEVSLPGADGFGLLEQFRNTNRQIPVLILSNRCSVSDRCRGLRLGADDYMAKPADPEELVLRIRALLRRCRADSSHELTVGQTVLHQDSFSLVCRGEQTDLPRKEFLILHKLLSNMDRTFTRRQLMDEIWEADSRSDEHTVVVHVNRLREKVMNNPDFAIVTIRGLGYRAVRR